MNRLTPSVASLGGCGLRTWDKPPVDSEPAAETVQDSAEPAADRDEDGFGSDVDCNDLDPAVFPGAVEICNEQDDDCDGKIDEEVASEYYRDHDGDGFGDRVLPVLACEQPATASTLSTDCDDSDAAVFPDAEEWCNEQDDDCDGEVDEDGQSTF